MPVLLGPDHRPLPADQSARGATRCSSTSSTTPPASGSRSAGRRPTPRGNFSSTASTPLPDSPYNVGPDGLLGTGDDYRLRDLAGPDRQPGGNRLERRSPTRSARSQARGRPPTSSSTRCLRRSPRSRRRRDSLVTSVGDDHVHGQQEHQSSTLNANTIPVISAGPDGVLGTADDVSIPLTNVQLQRQPLKNGPPGAGADQLHAPCRPDERPLRGRPRAARERPDHRHRRQPAERVGHGGEQLHLAVRG